MSIVENMKKRLSDLRVEKERIDHEFNEIEAALRVVAKFDRTVEASGDAFGVPSQPIAATTRATVLKTVNKRDLILKEVSEMLSKMSPLHTDAILVELQARGVSIGGDNPSANLSAYLSRARVELGLDHDRRRGWSLKKQTPESVDADSGVPSEQTLL